MNLKPFNLQEALANPERVVTRDGKKVSQLTKFDVQNDFCIVGELNEAVHSFTMQGCYHLNDSPNDLFLLPQTKTVWVVISKYTDVTFTKTFDSEQECIEFFNKSESKCISKPTPIEIEI